jgi:hypothetical protein
MISQTVGSIVLATSLFGVVGYASSPTFTRLSPVGPNIAGGSRGPGAGFLQVYSARVPAERGLATEIFFWNVDFGQNEFLHGVAHTGYTIFALDGKVLQKVRNANGMNDANPTPVELRPGMYEIQVEAEDYNGITTTVRIPVRIESGATTIAHLDGTWSPRGVAAGDLVRLPNGTAVGWRAKDSN